MTTQAKTGGEIGLNGEFYEGGQFLPSSENTVKGTQKPFVTKGSKKEIAPYKWEAAPADDMLSIYDSIRHFCTDNEKECEFVKGVGFVGFRFVEPFPTTSYPTKEMTADGQDWIYIVEDITPERRAWLESLIERFNNGERWMPLLDHKYHYKNQN